MNQQRRLPSVDRVLNDPAVAEMVQRYGRGAVKDAVQACQERWRNRGGDDALDNLAEPSAYAAVIERELTPSFPRVLNMSGTLLHTNLGRALIDPELAVSALEAASHPVALEYDLGAGSRGDRDKPVIDRLCRLTGAEDGTIVNNNAAAVLLVLNTLGLGKHVPVSRGELVEIGGSFRIPDIIERAGCRIREVGTTNRTHPKDFADAIDDSVAMLLKVHPSNYHIDGFTREVTLPELAEVAAPHSLPVVVDLGSGALIDMQRYGLPHEDTPGEVLSQGADLVTFSGDKLLGGCQAGFVVGRRDLIAQLKQNPLKRALRPDKITLLLTDSVLKAYEDAATLEQKIPFLRALALPLERIHGEAERLAHQLSEQLQAQGPGLQINAEPNPCQVGSGSLPSAVVESACVAIRSDSDKVLRTLVERLRSLSTPIVGRLSDGTLKLDLRSCDDWSLAEATLAELTL